MIVSYDASHAETRVRPQDFRAHVRYGNIEGVGWITPTRIVTVSDRRKKSKQPDKALSEKDQSVHIFEIPT
jgi:hypothetical protein